MEYRHLGKSEALVLRAQGHRAVLGLGVVEQRDLLHPGREQGTPVLAQPALRVTLAGENGLLQVIGGNRGAVRLLVPPGPRHGLGPPSSYALTEVSSGRVRRRTRWPRRPCRGR